MIAIVLPFACGCATSVTSTTALEIKSAARVTLLQNGAPVLPSRIGDQEVVPERRPLGRITFAPAPGGKTEIETAAIRAPSGEISIRWDTRLPLVNGEEQTLVPTTGLRDLPAPLLDPHLLPSLLRLDACADLSATGRARTGPRGQTIGFVPTGYAASAAVRPCVATDDAAVPLAIETDWDNVELTRRVVVTPQPGEGLLVAGVIAFVAGLGILPGVAEVKNPTAARDLAITSVGLIGTGLILGVTSLFLPRPSTIDETLRPDGSVESSRRSE